MTDAALVLVATPIGNVADISQRALEELRSADSIACEDTRRTGALLAHFSIAHDPFIVCNDHTEGHAAAEVVRRVASGQRVVLVSDAGTPAISDPGHRVVRAAIDAGVEVEAVPGPSAAVAALTLSGFATDRFVFEGFLPRKGSERASRLTGLASDPRTTVVFESPRRLVSTLADLVSVCGEGRRVAVARELTKTHEEVWRGSAGDAAAHFEQVAPRGEIVVVVEGAPPVELDDESLLRALEAERSAGASVRDAVAAVVAATGAPKRRVYDLAISR